jgi:hypothetical protein
MQVHRLTKINRLVRQNITNVASADLKAFPTLSRSFSQVPDQKPVEEKKGFFDRLWGSDSSVAAPSFRNRWAMVVPAVAAHVCIGSPYAWSLMSDMITREHGFVAAAASDWTLMQTALPLSIVFACQGVSAALLGKWQVKVGPRKTMAYAAACFGGALTLGSLGVYIHSLPLLYLGKLYPNSLLLYCLFIVFLQVTVFSVVLVLG